MYLVTKRFVSGILDGLTITERTTVRFEPGKRYGGVLGTSSYIVERVEQVEDDDPERVG